MVSLAGLPGVGKSTLARLLAARTGALWLRIDAIEGAMRLSHMRCDDLADGGYAAAQAVASGALRQGFCVIADCVNPWALTRAAWQVASAKAGALHLDVELVCSDTAAHRRRIEADREAPEGVQLPDWQAVCTSDYTPFDGALRLDTADFSAEAATGRIIKELEGRGWLN